MALGNDMVIDANRPTFGVVDILAQSPRLETNLLMVFERGVHKAKDIGEMYNLLLYHATKIMYIIEYRKYGLSPSLAHGLHYAVIEPRLIGCVSKCIAAVVLFDDLHALDREIVKAFGLLGFTAVLKELREHV